jgi:hypothetical protein
MAISSLHRHPVCDYSDYTPEISAKNREHFGTSVHHSQSDPIPSLFHIRPENKYQSRGMFLSSAQHGVLYPRQPRISPQIHQQNTTPKRDLSPKHPSKTRQNHQSPLHILSRKKNRKTVT